MNQQNNSIMWEAPQFRRPAGQRSSLFYEPSIPEEGLSSIGIAQHSLSIHTPVSNRHSYHGPSSSLFEQSRSAESSAVLPSFSSQQQLPGLSTPEVKFRQHSPPDQSVYRPRIVLRQQRSLDTEATVDARKRYSAGYSLALSSLCELGEESGGASMDRHKMHPSSDSLTGHRVHVDTAMQGPDMDSPRGGGGSVVSGHTSKRDDGMGGGAGGQQPPHMLQQAGIPLQGQVLVDPATGQHYLVPAAAAQPAPPPGYFYPSQPMYYQGQPQPQPLQPQPVPYYYGAPHGGYLIPASTPSQQTQQTQQQGYPIPVPGYAQPPNRFSSTPPYRNTFAASNEDMSRRDEERRFDDPHPPPSPSAFSTHSVPVHMLQREPSYPGNFGNSFSSFSSAQQQARAMHMQQYGAHAQMRASPPQQPEDPQMNNQAFRRDGLRSSGGAELQRDNSRASGEFARREFARSSAEFRMQAQAAPPPHSPTLSRGSTQSLHSVGAPAVVKPERGQPSGTPLYGPPAWWTGRRDEGESLTDVESRRPMPARCSPPQSTTSDTEAVRARESVAAAAAAAPAPRPVPAKPVRMDIDLNHLVEEEKPKAKPNRPAPAAFTVTFDGPSASSESLSLQDAARKSGTGRRLLRRTVGESAKPAPSPAAVTQSPKPARRSVAPAPAHTAAPAKTTAEEKSFLLNKLLQGAVSDTDAARVSAGANDNDVASDAGTYIVEQRPAGARSFQMQQQIVEGSDSDSDSTSSGGTSTASSSRTASPVREGPSSPPQHSEKVENDKRALLQELIRMRAENRAKAVAAAAPPAPSPRLSSAGSTVTSGARPSTGMPAARPIAGQRQSLGGERQSLGTAPTNRSVYGQRPPSAAASNASHSHQAPNNNFRRGDGGRFSMRSGVGGASPQTQPKSSLPQKPPFRAGCSRPVTTVSAQRDAEMSAWLRRKDYNPMKAAAEAKKAKELKASLSDATDSQYTTDEDRSDQFSQNRSMSFHVGPAVPKQRPNHFVELTRNKSDESLAQEEASQASQRLIAEYSRGMVKDINKLTQKTRASGGQKQLSGLEKAVEMLQNKCKKSIELIRSQNKGCLSVSVEDLLSIAAEPPRPTESLDDRLCRLSDAFDAVQRYLEQYSLDGRGSPIPEFSDSPVDPDPAGSVVSAFSSMSTRDRSPLSPLGYSSILTSPRPNNE